MKFFNQKPQYRKFEFQPRFYDKEHKQEKAKLKSQENEDKADPQNHENENTFNEVDNNQELRIEAQPKTADSNKNSSTNESNNTAERLIAELKNKRNGNRNGKEGDSRVIPSKESFDKKYQELQTQKEGVFSSSNELAEIISVEFTRCTIDKVGEFQKVVNSSMQKDLKVMIIDLSKAEILDTIFLGVLVITLKQMAKKSAELKIVTNPVINKNIFSATKLDSVFTINSSVEEVLEYIRQRENSPKEDEINQGDGKEITSKIDKLFKGIKISKLIPWGTDSRNSDDENEKENEAEKNKSEDKNGIEESIVQDVVFQNDLKEFNIEPIEDDQKIAGNVPEISNISIGDNLEESNLEEELFDRPRRSQLKIEKMKYGLVTIISLDAPKYTTKETLEFKEYLMNVVDNGIKKIIVVFNHSNTVNSSLFGVLVTSLKKIKEMDGDIRLVFDEDMSSSIFFMTGMDKKFQVYDELEEAIRSFHEAQT